MRLALAGDTMLGRGVGDRLREAPPSALFAPEVVAAIREADLRVLNLECCISERGAPTPGRTFHFRAPPAAAETLAHLGVDCVTLANNHALDFGAEALLDTFEHLAAAGIKWVGAGEDEEHARRPAVLEATGRRLRIVAFADHPAEYAATPDRPGTAFVDLGGRGLPDWLRASFTRPENDAIPTLCCPHWGPNMVQAPLPDIRRTADALVRAGATLVAGHSAHVFHGVAGRVLFDLGDFVDDYRIDPVLRNDLGVLWFVELDGHEVAAVEALPLKLDYCHTRLADGDDAGWIKRRLIDACRAFGTDAHEDAGRVVIAAPLSA
jgi:poly-gamma-glutamate capsule biosynthesis protein CapA/YwtB (metallophosphatase superfamily)